METVLFLGRTRKMKPYWRLVSERLGCLRRYVASVLQARAPELQLASAPVYLATGNPSEAMAAMTEALPGVKFLYRTLVSAELEPEDYIVQVIGPS
eukprot:6035269-Pyramimonas_sp.AAC.1